MKRTNSVMSASLLLAAASAALGDPVKTDVAGTTSMSASEISGLWYITLTVVTEDGNGENKVILNFDENDNVASISTVDEGDPGPVRLTIGAVPNLRPNNVRIVSHGVGELVIESMSITGDLGHPSLNFPAVTAARIESLLVEGDITRSILSRRYDDQSAVGTGIGNIVILGDLLASVNFQAQTGPDVIGEGAVDEIIVGGNIGSSGTPVVILGPLGIGSIEADDIYADISAVVDGYDPADIGTIVANADGGSGATGRFLGTVTTNAFTGVGAVIDVKGDFEKPSGGAALVMYDDLESDQLIRIGGNLPEDTILRLLVGGLEGQISINAENGSGEWDGEIWLTLLNGSPVNILASGYSTSPGSLGGGAAGTAPFTMHESTASPATPHYVFITGIDILDPMMECYDIPFDDEITFRLYGPVSLESGAGTPAKVQIKTGPSAWTDAFDVDAEIVSSTGSRGLKFVRKDGSGNPIAWPQTFGEYRIVPKNDRIICADVTGEPTADFAYYIELADGCGLQLLEMFDLSNDDDLTPDDIAEWMTTPVDFNEDTNADEDDLDLLMTAINLYNNR